MFGGLRKKLNEVWSGADFWDGKENQQQRQQFKAAPARTVSQPKQVAPATTQRRIDDSYGGGFSGLQNRLRDKFDGNTNADRIRRFATTGLDESYDQEQARKTKEAQGKQADLNAIQQVGKYVGSGVSELSKAPSNVMQLQGRVSQIKNPVYRTAAGLLIPGSIGAIAPGADKRGKEQLRVGRDITNKLTNTVQQSSFGDRADDNKNIATGGKMFGQLATQVAAPVVSTVAMGAQTAADESNRAEQAGKSNDAALGIGLLQGGATALSERFGIGKFLPGKGVPTGGLTTNLVKNVVKRSLTEGGQEAQQQFTSNLIANKTYNPNQGLTEGVAQSAIFGGLAGGAMSPLADISNQRPSPPPQLSPSDIAVLSDLQEVNLKRVQDPRVVTQVIAQAREIGAKNGVDLISGSPREINDRVNGLIDNFYNQQPKLTTSLVKNVQSKLTPLNTEGGGRAIANDKLDNLADKVSNRGKDPLESLKQEARKNEKYPGLVDEILNAPNARVASQLAEQRGIWLELSDPVLNVMKNDRNTALDIINNSKPKGDYVKKIQQPLEKKIQEAQAEMDKYGTGYINDIDRAAEQAKAKARLDQAKDALFQNSEYKLRLGKTDPLESLKAEARKYKSAEEFAMAKLGEKYGFRDRGDLNNRLNTEQAKYSDLRNRLKRTKNQDAKDKLDNLADKVSNRGKDPLDSLKQEARKYKSAEEFVKAQGKPLYHGARENIDTFDLNHLNQTYMHNGLGVNFTDNKDFAKLYSRGKTQWGEINKVDDGKGFINERLTPGAKVLDLTKGDKKVSDVLSFDNYKKLASSEGADTALARKNLERNARNILMDNTDSLTASKRAAAMSDDELLKLKYDTIKDKALVSGEGLPDMFRAITDVSGMSTEQVANAVKRFSKIAGSDVIKSTKENGSVVHTVLNPDVLKTKSQLTDLYNQAKGSEATQPPKSTPKKIQRPKGDGSLTKEQYDKQWNAFQKQSLEELKKADGYVAPKDIEIREVPIKTGAYKGIPQSVAFDKKTGKELITLNTGAMKNDVLEFGYSPYKYPAEPFIFDSVENAINFKTRGKQPSTPKTVEAKPKGFILAETKGRGGRKDTIRVKKGKKGLVATQQSEDVIRENIADALNIPKSDRTPTADDQRVQRVEEATQKSIEAPTSQRELDDLKGVEKTAKAPSSIKEKAQRQTFETVTKEYLGKTKSAQIERSAILADLNKRFKLNDKEKINAILARDDPNVKPMNQKVSEYIKEFKRNTDVAYSEYKAQGVKMGYVSSYLPRIYKNPTTGQEIDAVEFKLLQQGSKRMKGRDAEKVAVDWLVEKDPTKLLERYYNSMDKAVAGRQYLEKLENNGLVTVSNEPVRGLRPIVAEGLQTENGIYYAQKDVATKLNELFGSKEANNLVEKTLEKGAGVNSLFQSFVLSGGVPNTPINAFGIMQVMKEGMALHPIKAGKAFYSGMSKNYANKVFTAKKDIMRKMVENDLDLRVDLTQQGKSGRARIKEAFKESKAKGINEAWNEFTNDATFGRFMPMLEVLHFENIYKSAVNRGASEADAGRLAADSTKNFYGKTGNYKLETRSKSAQDAAGAVFFAPRFRESMVNFWIKNAKALNPKNLGKVEYRDNQKFMVASALTYAAMTMLNEALNGVQLWDNPDGKKDKLIIPASALEKMGIQTKGKDIAIPFLPSLATVPRNLASLAGNFATGKFNEAGKNAKSFVSMPLKTAGDILTNEDYFGNKIVQDDSSPLQKFTQAGSYIAASNMQPWIREGLNALGQDLPKDVKKTFGIKEKSTFEALSNAGEAPLRFYNPDTYRFGDNWVPKGGKDEKFTFKQQKERAAIKGELNGIAKNIGMNKRQEELFKSLSSVEFNEDGTLKEDKNPFYKSQRYTALQDDKVYEGMKQKAKLNAKLNGKPIDPIFDDNLAPDQRRVLLWKKTLPPGTSDPTVKQLYEQDWYQDYRNKESKYFADKTVWNKKMGYKDGTPNTNEYPLASKDVEAGQNTYFDLPKGGARTAFRNNNPDLWNKMIAYWDSKDAWTNGERSKLGLGALEDEYANSGSKGGGRGGKKGSKYDWTKDLFAGNSGSTSKALRKILEEAMNAKLV